MCCAPQLDNMLLHNAGQSEMLKLCDFGYSKDDGLGTEASGCKTACGTPEYMAPEVHTPSSPVAPLPQPP
jgi:serine/threonine protein kinase